MILASFVILNLSIGGLMENALPTILIKNNPTNYKQWFSILNSSFDIGMLVSNLIWQITSLIRTSPETFNGSLLMMDF